MFCLYVNIRMYWITIFHFIFQTSSFRKVATVCISSFAQTPPIRLWIHRGIWRKWMDGLRSLPGEKSVSVSHHSTPDILTRRVYKSALWSGLVDNFSPIHRYAGIEAIGFAQRVVASGAHQRTIRVLRYLPFSPRRPSSCLRWRSQG